MQTFGRLSAVLALCVAPLLPNRASACSCDPAPLYRTIPGADARDVPVDIAPVLEGPIDPASIKLTDDSGTAVEFTLETGPRVECLGGWAEVLPKQHLAPNTQYTIRANALYGGSVASLSFTTGDSELPDEPLAKPQLTAASVMRGVPDCGGGRRTAACLGGVEKNARDNIELLMRRGDEILLRTTTFIQDDGPYGLTKEADCVELRRRARDGRRSEPVKLCGDQLPVGDFPPIRSTSDWPSCHDGMLVLNSASGPTDAGAGASDQDAGVEPASKPDAGDKPDAAAAASDAGRPSRESDSGCSIAAGPSLRAPDLWLLLALGMPLGAAKLRSRKR